LGYDTGRPYVKSTIPAANASGVAISSLLVVQFSERMDESTIDSDTIRLYMDPMSGVPNLTLTYTDSLNLLTIDPSGNMEVNSRYYAVVDGDIEDYYGNKLQQDYWWQFWTATPSGYVYSSGVQPQFPATTREGYLEVTDTLPRNYTSNLGTGSVSPILVYLNDECEIGNRNFLGTASGSVPPAAIGSAWFEDPQVSLSGYVSIANQEVLGDPGVTHTAPTYSLHPSGDIIRIDGTGWLNNNEYIVTVEEGLPGLNTYPLKEDYQFVFTTTYSPIYAGPNIIRLNIGPMLAMVMTYIPDDTIRRFIYEASKQADRLYPSVIDPNNVPWYVTEFVIYQSKISGLYAAMLIFAGGGAGVRKRLGDLEIEHDARGLMPVLLPILEDYTERRDEAEDMVKDGTDAGIGPDWAILHEYDPRRPITAASWTRLPFRDLRKTEAIGPGGTREEPMTDALIPWIYAADLSGGAYIGTSSRFLPVGRYVTT